MTTTLTADALVTGTAGGLQDWINAYVEAGFEDGASIEYWFPTEGRDGTYGRDTPLPARVAHVACYVTKGSCEGWLLHVDLHADGQMRRLACAKALVRPHVLWAAAQALSEALDTLIGYGEMPAWPTTPRPMEGYAVVQEGGTSQEVYLHVSSTRANAEAFREECADAAYRTSEILSVPPQVAALGEPAYAFVEAVLQASNALEHS
jgi:hypothetical protein